MNDKLRTRATYHFVRRLAIITMGKRWTDSNWEASLGKALVELLNEDERAEDVAESE